MCGSRAASALDILPSLPMTRWVKMSGSQTYKSLRLREKNMGHTFKKKKQYTHEFVRGKIICMYSRAESRGEGQQYRLLTSQEEGFGGPGGGKFPLKVVVSS